MPTEPKNLTVFHLDQATIKLRWNSIGNYQANTVKYVVDCKKCSDFGKKQFSRQANCVVREPCDNYIQYLPNKNEIFDNE